MHIPRGFWKNALGDIDVIAHDGVLHAFHLCIPNHNQVAHLTSRDGLVWEEHPVALRTGDPGACDDDGIWTMGVFRHGDRFFMLYTGISSRERGKVQRVCLATSADLYTWEKHVNNPVICADPAFYEAAWDARHRVDWRDPYVYAENGELHGVICARVDEGITNRRGAAGHFISGDGFNWNVKPALCVPGNCYDFETPALCKIKGRYYLTGISGQNAETEPMAPSTFRVADRVEGPYRRVGHEALLPGDNQVFKPCRWGNQTLYFHNLSGRADWEGGGGCRVTCLAPPKVADTAPDGELILRPFLDWQPLEAGVALQCDTSTMENSAAVVAGRWQSAGGDYVSSGETGFEAFLTREEQGDCIVESAIAHEGAGAFGIILRADDQADDATFVLLEPQVRRIQLCTIQKTYKTPSAGVTYRWRGRRVVQEWVCPWEWSGVSLLRVVACGPYCEVSLDNRVAISAVTMTRSRGRVGVFAEDARVAVRSLSIQPINPPPCLDSCA